MDNYSPSEFIRNCFDYVRTKLFYNKCRFIRFPFYIRGRKSMVGADQLTLGHFCRFELDGNKESLKIGSKCEMGDMTHIVALNDVTIGNNVLIASKCFISDTNHGIYKGESQDSPEIPPNQRKLVTRPVKIGNNVWIGENAVILAGAEIGDGCIIGANAVVSKKIEAYSIVIGAGTIYKQWNQKSGKWEKYTK